MHDKGGQSPSNPLLIELNSKIKLYYFILPHFTTDNLSYRFAKYYHCEATAEAIQKEIKKPY